MLRRVTPLFAVFILLVTACGNYNEPYVLLPLGVTTFRDGAAGTTSTHVYNSGKIQSFIKTSGADTLTKLQFLYQGDRLKSIMKDSSAAGYDLVRITGYGSDVTIDSIFSIAGEVVTLKEVRKQSYDVNHLLQRIDLTQRVGTGFQQGAYELDWTGSNVSEIRAIGINEGTETVLHVLAITYDERMGVFSNDIPYVYTLAPSELYWLSANNPIRFKLDDKDEVRYGYYYNLKGYPARIFTDTKNFMSCAYKELR